MVISTGRYAVSNPVHHALTSSHAHLALREGRAAAYPVEMAAFLGLPEDPDASDWEAAARLMRDGIARFHIGADPAPPQGWTVLRSAEASQMAPPPGFGRVDRGVRRLGPQHEEAMLALARTSQGNVSIGLRAMTLGPFVGVVEDGRLVAMGGFRFRGAGWMELSAGVVRPERRREGLGARLLRHRVALADQRGARSVLHVFKDNPAHRYFTDLGWSVTHDLRGVLLTAPTTGDDEPGDEERRV